MNIELELREMLLPVFGLDSIDEIKPEHSLIGELGAESLDFVEIFHLIDRKFRVEITADTLMAGGSNLKIETLFDNGRLTENGKNVLQKNFNSKKGLLEKGMTKVQLFSLITVGDLAKIIESKIR
jgi:acyl carrier protein